MARLFKARKEEIKSVRTSNRLRKNGKKNVLKIIV